MNLSIFDATGPVMVGPSSSHTAGAARLARFGRMIAARPFSRVLFQLHGSFAKTYLGHGTDKALVAGALGLAEDDERIRDAFDLARQRGLSVSFSEIELHGAHENSVRMVFFLDGGGTCEITGSSIGGGQIVITRMDDFDIEFTAMSSTLMIRQRDEKGVVSEVSRILAENDINIGTMKLSRLAKGDLACCIIETDHVVPQDVVLQICGVPAVLDARAINIPSDGSGIKEV